MSKKYALAFTSDGVRVLQGRGKSQDVVGEVALDDPFLETRLEDLRTEIEQREGGPVGPQVLIPHSEILFTTLKVEDDDKEVRETAVREELDGLTPYDLDDLVYDWKAISRTQIQVAAVARETLREADAFVAARGFAPGAFSADPKPGQFRGMPDFGRSDRPVPVVEPDPAPTQTPASVAAQDAGASVAEGSGSAAPMPAAPSVDSDKMDAPVTEPATEAGTGATARSTNGGDSKPAREMPGSPDLGASDGSRAAPSSSGARESDVDATKDTVAARLAAASASMAGAAQSQTAKRTDEIVPLDDEASQRAAHPPADATESASKPADETDRDAVAGAFSTRRTVPSRDATAGAKEPARTAQATPDASRLSSIASRIAMLPDGGAGPTDPAATDSPAARSGAPAVADQTRSPLDDVPPMPGARPGAAPTSRKGASAPTARGGPASPPGPTGPAAPVPVVRKVDPPAPQTGGAAPLTAPAGTDRSRNEAESMTIFGARPEPQSRLTSVLPIAIGLAVAILLAGGIWSLFFLMTADNIEPAEIDPQIATVPDTAIGSEPDLTVRDAPIVLEQPDPEIAALPQAADPSVSDPAASDQADAAPAAQTDGQDQTDTIAIQETASDGTEAVSAETAETDADAADLETASANEPAAELEPESSEASAVETAEVPDPNDPLRRPAGASEDTRYAATGIDTGAPSRPAEAAVDAPGAPPTNSDGSSVAAESTTIALAAPDLAGLTGPSSLSPPPPPGARFDFGPDGRVIATPDGTLSPQGVRVFSGAPPRVPPATPERPDTTAAPSPTSTDADATSEDAETATGDQSQLLPTPDVARLATLAPRSRPGGVALDALGDVPSDSGVQVFANADPNVVRLAAFSPVPRPERPSVVAAETLTVDPATSAAIAAAAAAAIEQIVPAEPESPYAATRSPRPAIRSTNLERRAARALEQARQQPVQVAAAGSTVTPRNPTAGSVASRATQDNVLRLNKVNLIGVYGSQANRRALVRLPSGRFVKVKVGDRMDGGRVRAIDTSRLQYVKSGRAITLSMPNG